MKEPIFHLKKKISYIYPNKPIFLCLPKIQFFQLKKSISETCRTQSNKSSPKISFNIKKSFLIFAPQKSTFCILLKKNFSYQKKEKIFPIKKKKKKIKYWLEKKIFPNKKKKKSFLTKKKKKRSYTDLKNQFFKFEEKISYFLEKMPYACLKKTSFPNENSFLWLLEKTKDFLYLILIIVRHFF